MKLSKVTVKPATDSLFGTVVRFKPQNNLYTQRHFRIQDFRSLQKQFPSLPLNKLTFASLDCEFLPCKQKRIIGEVAVVRFNLAGLIDCFHTVVKHENVEELEFASKKSKARYQQISKNAPTIRVIRKHLKTMTEGCIWVSHGVGPNLLPLDYTIIFPHLPEREIVRRQKYSLETAYLSYLSVFQFNATHVPSLSALAQALKVSQVNPHAAISDAEATAQCSIALLQRFMRGSGHKMSPGKTFEKLADVLVKRKLLMEQEKQQARQKKRARKVPFRGKRSYKPRTRKRFIKPPPEVG